MFESVSLEALTSVSGGCMTKPVQTPDNFNTGITGGLDVPNNQVPRPGSRDPGYNTGITGGLKIPNNKVPRPRF